MTTNELRGKILRALYDAWRRDNAMWAQVGAQAIAEQTGIPFAEVAREAQYLGAKGLLKDLHRGHAFCPTPDGIEFVEHPEHFPQHGGLIVLSAGHNLTVIGSQIGSVGDFRREAAVTWDQAEAVRILHELRGLIQAAHVDRSTRDQATADLDALEVQAARPRPNPSALRALVDGLATTIQTTAALVQLDPQLPARLQQLRTLIEPFFRGGG